MRFLSPEYTRQLSLATGYTAKQWEEALQQSANRLKVRHLSKLAKASLSPDAYLRAISLLENVGNGDGDEGFQQFATYVDESPYDLQNWLEAVEEFHRWLERNGKKTESQNIIGYISCSAEALKGHPVKPGLADVLKEMLESYGCDAAK